MASEARYRPKPVEGDIPEDEFAYVELFVGLEGVVEAAEGSTERIVLLLSTCRNAWMTINAVFVDIRKVIGARELYDDFSHLLYRLGRGEVERAIALRNGINFALDQVQEKLKVWDERLDLMRSLEGAIDQSGGVDRSRLRAFLARQKQRRPTQHTAHGRFLSLNLDTVPSEADELIELLREMEKRLHRLSALAEALVPVSTALGPLLREGDEGEGAEQSTIFDESPEQLEAIVRRAMTDAWPAIAEALARLAQAAPGFGKRAEAAAADDVSRFSLADARAELVALLAAMREAVVAEQGVLTTRFEGNVAVTPMPAPFVVDLSRIDEDMRPHGKRFEVERRVADAGQKDTARIALLRCGLTEEAYCHVDPKHYGYGEDREERGQVTEAARAALKAAADAGCDLVAMPEVFLPRNAENEICSLASEQGIALVSGLEYRRGDDHRLAVNELAVSVPGVAEVAHPRKQKPSVYEVREQEFEGDDRVWLFRHTAVGNLGVIVCSDYLEDDIVSALASVPERLDTLIVCSRNPAPAVFKRMAMADAARLYASVVVVNARPDLEASEGRERSPASSDGTLVAVPTRKGLLDPVGEPIALDVPWASDDEEPSLVLYDLPLAKIRNRDRRRTGDGEFLPAPYYTRKEEDREE